MKPQWKPRVWGSAMEHLARYRGRAGVRSRSSIWHYHGHVAAAAMLRRSGNRRGFRPVPSAALSHQVQGQQWRKIEQQYPDLVDGHAAVVDRVEGVPSARWNQRPWSRRKLPPANTNARNQTISTA